MVVGFVHTALGLPPVFDALADELLPEAERFHLVDESLLGVTRRVGRLTPTTSRRVLETIESAVEAGAGLVVVTCSSLGPAVEAARPFIEPPVVRIDEAMADAAVAAGTTVGVLATLPTTLEPTGDLVARRAAAAGKDVRVVSQLCDGAFDALARGDRDRHDELVLAGLQAVARAADVVVLAQASMARVVDATGDVGVPVLSSPRLGMERVAALAQSR
ncbi:MAG TPA: aspartate/glutamate racemase family protein [Gaiellaceae bacterium]|nr:aspartate/glutamate racemase family protein [Gaiellaceae bacterium]